MNGPEHSAAASPERVVIVGAGLAGYRTAAGLRQLGYGGSITLIGDEPGLPYDRPPLSKQILTGKWPVERARLVDHDGLDRLGISYLSGTSAVGLGAQSVRLADGSEVPYDALVLATGSAARTLPGVPSDPRIHTLRSATDSASVGAHLAAGPLLVVGAGLIGGEVASAARAAGQQVTMVEATPHPFRRALGETAGRVLAALHRSQGTEILLETTVMAWDCNGDVLRVALDDGRVVEVASALVAVGSIPQVGWLAGAGLEIAGGIQCDASGRVIGMTNCYAVGDVSAWAGHDGGSPERSEHWTNALEQAGIVAATIAGIAEPAALGVPYVWTDQCGIKVQVVGSLCGSDATEILWQTEDFKSGVIVRLDGPAVAGIALFNTPRLLGSAKALVAGGASLEQVQDQLQPPVPVR